MLSVLACASFALAFLHGRRGAPVAARRLARAAALRAQLGALPGRRAGGRRGCGCGGRGASTARDGALLAAGVALAYAPWVPSLLFQAANTAAPWASRPNPLYLLGHPGRGCSATWRCRCWRSPPSPRCGAGRCRRACALLALVAAVAAALLAFLGSQLEPAWATRYLAVLFGPLLLVLAAVLARGAGWTWLALAGVVGVWLASGPAPAKSNVRTVAATVGARAAARRPRGLHPARAGAGARPLPAAGPALPHAARAGGRAAGDRLARRRRATARRARGVGAGAAASTGCRAGRRVLLRHARLRAALAGAVEPRGPQPHARVADLAADATHSCARSAARPAPPGRAGGAGCGPNCSSTGGSGPSRRRASSRRARCRARGRRRR